MTAQLTISVIVPVRNDRRVTRALDSLLAQELPDDALLDIVVVDDSDDGHDTPALLAACAAAHPELIRVSATPGGARGVNPARNHGLARARARRPGDVVTTLNADDRYADRRVLADVAAAFRAGDGPAPDLVHGAVEMFDARGRLVYASGPVADPYVFRGTIIPDIASFWRRGFVDRQGPYREDLRICGDYEFFIRALCAGMVRRDLRRVTGIMDSGGSSSPEAMSRRAMLWERLRCWRGHGLGSPLMLRAEWAYLRATALAMVSGRSRH